MKEIKRILFPVDLSENSEKLAPTVKTMVEKFDGELHVIFVVRALDHLAYMNVPYPSIQEFQKSARDGADRRLNDYCAENFPNIKNVSIATLIGDPAHEILNYAADAKIDIIIMGTHGRTGADRLFFGSVADKVVKNASVPVMTINPHDL